MVSLAPQKGHSKNNNGKKQISTEFYFLYTLTHLVLTFVTFTLSLC